MKTVTWTAGTNKELDDIFDYQRKLQFNDTHRLAKNYSAKMYDFSIALTIAFDHNENPVICSSIASRSCWPKGAYRVMNRLWKTKENRIKHSTFVSDAMIGNLKSQIEWLNQNTNHQLYFISREKDGWRDWSINKLYEQFGITFKKADGKYLTCPDETHESCWQYIIYQGNDEILTDWKSKK